MTVAALTAAPIMALRAILFIMSLAVSSFLPAPIIWFSSIAVPVDIMNEAEKTHENNGPIPLDAEGMALAEGKRFTFDVITVPTDPLR